MAEKIVEVKGLKPYMKRVKNRNDKLRNMSQLFKMAVSLYHAWIIRNFNAQGSLHENKKYKWKPLKESTIRNRRKGGRGAKILQDTGSLKRDWELRNNKSRGIIKSAHAYSVVHEYGATIPAGIIVPKNAKALRWVGSDGIIRFSKKVKRPKINIPRRKIFPDKKQAHKIISPAFSEHFKWKIR